MPQKGPQTTNTEIIQKRESEKARPVLPRLSRKVHGFKCPGLSVEPHCRIVESVARALLNQIPRPLRYLFSDGSVTLAASRDLGKVSPGFVKKIFPQLLPATPSSAVFYENYAEGIVYHHILRSNPSESEKQGLLDLLQGEALAVCRGEGALNARGLEQQTGDLIDVMGFGRFRLPGVRSLVGPEGVADLDASVFVLIARPA